MNTLLSSNPDKIGFEDNLRYFSLFLKKKTLSGKTTLSLSCYSLPFSIGVNSQWKEIAQGVNFLRLEPTLEKALS